MSMILRHYQRDSIAAIYSYFENNGGNALCVMPTGSGKAPTLSTFIKGAIEDYSDCRIVSLVHSKKLVRQNLETLIRVWPDCPVSIYSAGMRQKKLSGQVVCASIQSIYGQAYRLQRVDLLLVDEAQLIPHKDTGMYRKLIGELLSINPGMKIVMWTATPFRTDTGRLDEGEGALCDGVAYELGLQQAIDWGWLCPLTTIPSRERISADGIKRSGGEFNQSQIAAAASGRDLIMRHAEEMVEMAFDRKHWIVFEAGVQNAKDMAEALNAVGLVSRSIHSGMDDAEIEDIYRGYQEGHIHAVTNADMLTVGADFPKTNFLGVRRLTDSPGLWTQICGRGTRVRYEDGFDPGTEKEGAALRRAAIARGPKPDCLVGDFGGNAARHGPLDQISGKKYFSTSAAKGEAPQKDCPACSESVFAGIRQCPYCGHELPPPDPQLLERASKAPLLSAQIEPEWIAVKAVNYARHTKPGKPDSMKVTYQCGLNSYAEWVCLSHEGGARRKAEAWWIARGPNPIPASTDLGLTRASELRKPSRIKILRVGKYPQIIGYDLDNERNAA